MRPARVFRDLGSDHKELLRCFDDARRGDTDTAGRSYLIERLVALGSVHEAVEELAVWPAVRKQVGDGATLADQALDQERDGRYYLDTLRSAPSGPSRRELLAQYEEACRGHIDFEEQQVWPVLQRSLSMVSLAMLRAKVSLARRVAPTRPHRHGPDRPFGLMTRGVAAAGFDRLRDRVTGRDVLARTTHGRSGLEVLRTDHRRIEALLDEAAVGRPDHETVAAIVTELSIHDAIEKEYLYPLVQARLADGHSKSQHGVAEHGEIAGMLTELDRRPADDPHRPEILDELIPLARTHFVAEETDLFGALADAMPADELTGLGDKLTLAKKKVPTRPHPHAPHSGLGSRLARRATGPFDKARDIVGHRGSHDR